jgi:hypothetical protein
LAINALNAAPNQNPFAFECKVHYRTDRLEFELRNTNVRVGNAIIRVWQQNERLFWPRQQVLIRHISSP